MAPTLNTIWDGITFRRVDSVEAEKLESEDKCQNLTRKFFSGTELKRRAQFAGYTTRELRADSFSNTSPGVFVDPRLVDWKHHKKPAADFLGKPFARITRADVEAYLVRHVEPRAS
jgi:hypothetical protein